jgi:hypothetical protein
VHPLPGRESGGTLADLDVVIGDVEKALILHRVVDRCRARGTTETTFSVDPTARLRNSGIVTSPQQD